MKTEINYTIVSKKILKPNSNCWLVKFGLGLKIGCTFDGWCKEAKAQKLSQKNSSTIIFLHIGYYCNPAVKP